MAASPKALIDKLNTTCKKALEQAIALCMSRTHFNVELEHWLIKILEGSNNDLAFVFRQYGLDAGKVKRELEASLNAFKTGNGRPPALASEILDATREAWVFGSLEQGGHKVRSAHLLAAILADRMLGERVKASSRELGRLSVEKLQAEMADLLPRVASEENDQEAAAAAVAGPGPSASTGSGPAPAGGGKTPALDQFTVNLTANAKAGKIDPVVGRDHEIRQVIDILTRRRQNNPILTGSAGVGKTAVVEGLALRIVGGDVPEPLKAVQLHTRDLGLLQAGAGVKGEFENRLKSVIDEVKRSAHPIILFIDEAHTMIGAGGAAGQNDAANLLKPALARGELRTIAATTFAEYKKYFEKDPALSRRFQVVKVEEPDEAVAIRMMRGIADTLEQHHQVRILDDAVREVVRLSNRYISGRQLPDKAVSLLATACARVRMGHTAVPPAVEDCRRRIEQFGVAAEALEREQVTGAVHDERLAELDRLKSEAETELAALERRWREEARLAEEVRKVRERLEAGARPATPAKRAPRVGAQSPDRAPPPTEGLPKTPAETFGRTEGHGRETVPQQGETFGRAAGHGRETVPQQGVPAAASTALLPEEREKLRADLQRLTAELQTLQGEAPLL